MKDADAFFGMKNFGKILCCDIDGVIFSFDGWKGENKFGAPIKGASETLNYLRSRGWYIVLFTTRIVTKELNKALTEALIPFDDINGRINNFGYINYQYYGKNTNVCYRPFNINYFWRHNPYQASHKPIASVYIDDMSWENNGKNYTKKTWKKVRKSLDRRFNTDNRTRWYRKIRFWREISKAVGKRSNRKSRMVYKQQTKTETRIF